MLNPALEITRPHITIFIHVCHTFRPREAQSPYIVYWGSLMFCRRSMTRLTFNQFLKNILGFFQAVIELAITYLSTATGTNNQSLFQRGSTFRRPIPVSKIGSMPFVDSKIYYLARLLVSNHCSVHQVSQLLNLRLCIGVCPQPKEVIPLCRCYHSFHPLEGF